MVQLQGLSSYYQKHSHSENVETQLVEDGKGFGRSEVSVSGKDRAFYVGDGLGVAATGLVDVVAGIGTGILDIATLGLVDGIHRTAHNFGESARLAGTRGFKNLTHAYNPKAKFDLKSSGRGGLFYGGTAGKVSKLGRKLAKENNVIKKQLFSRVAFGVAALTAPVARVAEFASSLVLVPLSLLTLGRSRTVNSLAARSLQYTGIVEDASENLLGILNPKRGGEPNRGNVHIDTPDWSNIHPD